MRSGPNRCIFIETRIMVTCMIGRTNMVTRKMLRLSAAAAYLGTSPTSLKRWTNLGLCPCLKSPMGHRYWTTQLLDEIFENMVANGGAADEDDEDSTVRAQPAVIADAMG